MPINNDPNHYYNNPEKLTQRRDYVVKLRDYALIAAVVCGGAVGLESIGVIEAPSPDVVEIFSLTTLACLGSATLGEFTQRSMSNRLNELQQPPSRK